MAKKESVIKIMPTYAIAVIALILTMLGGCAPSATDAMESYLNYEAVFQEKVSRLLGSSKFIRLTKFAQEPRNFQRVGRRR